MRDYMQAMHPEMGQTLPSKQTFVINTNNPLVAALPELDAAHPELAEQLAKEVYDLSSLSQLEIDPKKMPEFIQRTTQVLKSLVELALKK